jgi:hypothetical protein
MPAFGTLLATFGVTANSVVSSNVAVLVSGSGAVQIGDLAFAVFGQQIGLTVTDVVDNLGHTYTATNVGTDAGSMSGRAFYARMTSNGTLSSLTGLATDSTNNLAFPAAIFAGPFDNPPADVNIANTTAGSAANVYTCPASGARGQFIELVVGWMARGNAGASAALAAVSPNLTAIHLASQTVAQAIIGYQTTINSSSFSPVFTAAGEGGPGTAGVRVLGTTSFRFTQLMGQGVV